MMRVIEQLKQYFGLTKRKAEPPKQEINAEIQPTNSSIIIKGIDLSNSNLEGIDLSNAEIIAEEVDFTGKNLKGANFTNAYLELVSLENANLTNANLTGANLKSTIFWSTNLKGANFRNADLSHASLSDSNLRGANFTNANLEGATLPDDEPWTEDTNMSRFTDDTHDDFWESSHLDSD
jgi:uncharacterized protein YjbI with pentapeptide repeats